MNALGLTFFVGLLLILPAVLAAKRIPAAFPGSPPPLRWLLAAVPLCAAILTLLTWVSVLRSPWDDWNGARTAPAVAWARGMPLYYPHGVGPATDFIHGPMAAVMRLPAAWASTPTGAIIIADAINAALFYLPVVLFVLQLGASGFLKGVALVIFWAFSFGTGSLIYSAYQVHADAPAVGLALLGCVFASRLAGARPGWWPVVLAALCAVLSTASKQNLAPILAVLPVYVFFRNGWRQAATLAALELLLGVLVAGVCVRAFGSDAIVFQMFTLPSRHPWHFQEYGRLQALLVISGYLIEDAVLPAGVLVFFALVSSIRPKVRGSGPAPRLVDQAWFLPLLTAVLLVPSALIGRAKEGGAANALTPATYFLVVALVAWIADFRLRDGEAWTDWSSRLVLGSTSLMCVMLTLVCLNPWPKLIDNYHEIADLGHTPQQVAYEFSLKHSNAAYFPWNPLSTLMADGKYYHFEYGIGDYYLAGDIPPPEQIRAQLPSAMAYLIYPPKRQSEAMRGLLGAFSARRESPELPPGWIVYTRP